MRAFGTRHALESTKMPTKIVLVSFCLFNIVTAQLNGEFWWLNDKVKQYNGGQVPPARFEELSEFDNDENDKVVFGNEVDGVTDKLVLNLNVETEAEIPGKRFVNGSSEEAHDKTGGGRKVKESKNNVLKLHFSDVDSLVWPQDFGKDKEQNIDDKSTKENAIYDENTKDKFKFNFPNNFVKYFTNSTNKSSPMVESKPYSTLRDQITFKLHIDAEDGQKNSENICNHMIEEECYQHDGFVYKPKTRSTKSEMKYSSLLVCCILPFKPELKSSKFVFPETNHKNSFRFPRSIRNEDLDKALNQRQALITKRLSSNSHHLKPSIQPEVTQRIVTTDDDYEDPYANIKNHNFQTQRPRPYPSYANPNYGADTVNDDDYTDELPKPGLEGIYSVIGPRPSSWTFTNDEFEGDVGEEEFDAGYDVFTATPRLDRPRPVPSAPPNKWKSPSKLTAPLSEKSKYESDIATVRYQSKPNFQVLEGFKLLNLVRNKSGRYKNSRKSTTESITEDSPETAVIDAQDYDFDDNSDSDKQVFKGCGRAAKEPSLNERLTGEAGQSSNPWLVLVVRARREKTTLCHATLVHPRAVVTTAHCVHGAAPGEIIIHAGVWDMRDQSQRVQQRMASVHVHPRYNYPAGLAHDLAVLFCFQEKGGFFTVRLRTRVIVSRARLGFGDSIGANEFHTSVRNGPVTFPVDIYVHWNRPLRLNTNVQPICLSGPHDGDSCHFTGWGGKGQEILNKPRWQRASIADTRECSSRFNRIRGERLPTGAFCAISETQGCVTGIGGALVCTSNGRKTAVGIVVWRETCDVTSPVVLLPIQEWVQRALSGLGII